MTPNLSQLLHPLHQGFKYWLTTVYWLVPKMMHISCGNTFQVVEQILFEVEKKFIKTVEYEKNVGF